MKAVLLAGGYGKRLEPLTLSTPKCLLPVACKPNLAYVLELLEGVPGITEVVLSTNEVQAGMLRAALKEMSQDKVKVVVEKTTSNENKLGAVKAIKYVFDEVGYDDAVIIGSDNFIHGLDLKDVVGKFRKEKASAAIILHELEDERLVEKLGIAVLDSKNNVSFFQEKPKLSEAKSRLASTAIYCVSKRFLDGALGKYIAEKESSGEKPDNLGDLWAHSLKTEKILGIVFTGVWGDIGDVNSYLAINRWALDHLRKSQALVEENATVSGNASLGPFAVVSSGARIRDNAVVSNTLVFKGAEVGEGAQVEGSVLDYNAKIGENAVIENGCIVGKNAVVGRNARLPSNSKLWPNTSYGLS